MTRPDTHPAIGEAFGGGYFAGLIRIGSNTYGLIVAPKADGEISAEWGAHKSIKGADSFFDGQANTKAMSAADNNELGAWAKGLTIGGESDWYIPSRDELEVCYRNLKPTDGDNVCWSGDNPSAYLPSYAYTPDTPLQTTVEAFREGGAEAFEPTWYWSSTQYAGDASGAWGQYFGSGTQGSYGKGGKGRVRAVRRVLID
jgi:hypothetical protein